MPKLPSIPALLVPLLVAMLAALAPATAAAAPELSGWTRAEPLQGHLQPQTVTLPDGDALVVGGSLDLGAPPTPDPGVARYDVETGRWSEGSPLPYPPSNSNGTATVLLPSGRVLVVGGAIPGQNVTAVQLYDPATDTWEQRTPLTPLRWAHTATLLDDGTVLVAGGIASDDPWMPSATATAALYDPIADSWTPVAPMPGAMSYAAATKLPDGDVIVSGGPFANGVVRFDAQDRTWTTLPSLPQARWLHTVVAAPDGSLLLAGGIVDNGMPTTGGLDRYDPADGSAESLLTATAFPVADAEPLPGGRVLLLSTGPTSPQPSPQRSAVFDPATRELVDVGTPPSQQDDARLVPLGDGSFLALGGWSTSGGTDRFSTRPAFRTAAADFGEQTTGRRGVTVSVPLTAAGQLLAALGAATIEDPHAADFTIVADGCDGLALGRGDSCFVGIRFRPSAEGERTATLAVASPLSPGRRVEIPLSGVGLAPPVAPQPPGDGGGGRGTPPPPARRPSARPRTPTTLHVRCGYQRRAGRRAVVVCTGLPRTLASGNVRLYRAGILHATGTLKRGRLTLTVRRRLFDRRYTLAIGNRRPIKLVID